MCSCGEESSASWDHFASDLGNLRVRVADSSEGGSGNISTSNNTAKDKNKNDISPPPHCRHRRKDVNAKGSCSNSIKSIKMSCFINRTVASRCPVLLTLFLTLCYYSSCVGGVCVWQGGGGYRLACGFRQSGLFRIRSLGGLKGYVGAGFTLGDEDGFKDSMTNTDPIRQTQSPQQGYTQNSYQRLGTEGGGGGGGGSPIGLEEIKRQEQLRYLQQIQTEQLLEHQVLQQQAASQRQQKQLQNRRLPLNLHTPQSSSSSTAAAAHRGPPPTGTITKRASLWRWPFGKGGADGRGRDASQKHGPPPSKGRMRPPPLLRRGQQGSPLPPGAIPVAAGPLHGYPRAINRQGQPGEDEHVEDFEGRLPHPHMRQAASVPPQRLVPPPSGPGAVFRKNPQQSREEEQSRRDFRLPVPHGLQMLQNTRNYGSAYKLVHQAQIPVGEGGQKFQRIKQRPPPSSPLPSPSPPSSASDSASQLHRSLAPEDEIFLSGLGNLDRDALRTAVYDPNIFPDIYFTTTERGNKFVRVDDGVLFDDKLPVGEEELLRQIDEIERAYVEASEGEVEEENPEPTEQTPKKKLRRKKLRILKKKGEALGEVSQNLDDPQQAASASSNQGQGIEELDGVEPLKKRRKKKGGRRKMKVENVTRGEGSSEKSREAVISWNHYEVPISGPSPFTDHPTTFKTTTPTTTTTTTERTTTTPKIEISFFGYHEALDEKGKSSAFDEGGKDNIESIIEPPRQSSYDPRFPPTHEINRGRIPDKFIRHRGEGTTKATPIKGSEGLNVQLPPSKSLFELELQPTMGYSKFAPSTELSSSFVRFDSTESARELERTRNYNDQFYSQYNKSYGASIDDGGGPTAFSNSGFYDIPPKLGSSTSPPPAPPQEIFLPWEKRYNTLESTSSRPIPIYTKKVGVVSSTSPSYKDVLFGEEDDASSNWEAPNFWGSIQQMDRYGPAADFVTNDNFKRVLDLGGKNSFNGGSGEDAGSRGGGIGPPPSKAPSSLFHDMEDGKFPTYFSSTTPNSITPSESKWIHVESSTKRPTVATYFHSSSSNPLEWDKNVEELHPEVERIPVKELDFDELPRRINSPSSNSTTTTPQSAPTISTIRNNHLKIKKKTPKIPEVQIKIKGENQRKQEDLPDTREVSEILGEEDEKSGGDRATSSSSSNFVPMPMPSSPPLFNDGNPLRNFDETFPHNPFTTLDLNKQIKYIEKINGQREAWEGRLSPQILQHRDDLEEHFRIYGAQPKEYGLESQIPHYHYEHEQEGLPNIVPSPPDPVLKSEKEKKLVEFPKGIPVLKPPSFFHIDEHGNVHWGKDAERQKVIPKPIQVFPPMHATNPPQQMQPQQQPHQYHEFYGQRELIPQQFNAKEPRGQQFQKNDQRHMPQVFQQRNVQRPGELQREDHDQSLQQQQQQQKFHFQHHQTDHQRSQFHLHQQDQRPQQSFGHQFEQSNNDKQYHKEISNIKQFSSIPPQKPQNRLPQNPNQNIRENPSIKLVRPLQGSNNYPSLPVLSHKVNFEEDLNKYHPHQQQAPQLQFQQTPPKIQFQKNGPPKKYQEQTNQVYLKQQKPTGSFPAPNIDLPQNPFVSGNLQVQPTKIPAQKFQPPPLPTKSSQSVPNNNGGFLSMLNPFNRGSSSNNFQSSNNPPNQGQGQQSQQPQNYQQILNHVNAYNTRFEPPPPPPSTPPVKGVDVTFVDLDDNLPPPKLVPMQMLPQLQHPQQLPPGQQLPRFPKVDEARGIVSPKAALSEKERVLQAIATLNNVKYDVIQSVAEEQFGSEILQRIKEKKAQSSMTALTTTPKPFPLQPLLTTLSPLGVSLFNGMTMTRADEGPGSSSQDSQRSSGLSNLLNSFGGYGDYVKPAAPKSTNPSVSLNTDAITNLFNSLTSGEAFSKPNMQPTAPKPTIKVSLDGMTRGPSNIEQEQQHDIKSLQAQLAKAIIAKAQRKKEEEVPAAAPSNFIDGFAKARNYTQSQISTLKKLIALNNIEQKLNDQFGGVGVKSTTPTIVGPTIQSLLAQGGSNSVFSSKMLRDSEPVGNSVQSNFPSNSNEMSDPTLTALKAFALNKQQIQNQREIANIGKKEDPIDFKPIPVDLSAILSPAPPLEVRKRRLTDIRNAPRSFYPANATLGFDASGSGPGSTLSTGFDCEQQSFYPGLYADSSLGCKVLKCNWSLYVDCAGSEDKYHFNKYLSQSFQFLKVLGEFSKNATNNG